MDEEHARIDVTSAESLRCWSEKLGASPEELRSTVDKVGPRVADVRQHLVGGFTTAGPTS
ncbi:MAG TPA: DUF3606 domain-containing protein [Burkholderiales bacterium]|nr:DUF3606 domain-containing protein [Burkholderiales bacterium]